MTENEQPAPPPKPWDQLPDEKAPAYYAFLIYTYLGIRRTIANAYSIYRENKEGEMLGLKRPAGKKSNTSKWYEWSRFHDWQKRAQAWDIEQLKIYGGKFAVLMIENFEIAARRLHDCLSTPETAPATWQEAMDALAKLSSHLPTSYLDQVMNRND